MKVQCAQCGFKQPKAVQLKDGTGRYTVVCNCGMNTGPCKTEEKAWAKWNHRVHVVTP